MQVHFAKNGHLKPAKSRPSSANAKRAKGGGDDCEEAGRRESEV